MSSEIMFERIQENLQVLKMKNTLEILPNYLERAVKDDLNIIEVLDHLFAEEARGKKQRAYENQVRMSAIPRPCSKFSVRTPTVRKSSSYQSPRRIPVTILSKVATARRAAERP